jgi:hypothetical protein
MKKRKLLCPDCKSDDIFSEVLSTSAEWVKGREVRTEVVQHTCVTCGCTWK